MCPCNWPKLADSWARCALLAIAKRIRYIAPCHVTGSSGEVDNHVVAQRERRPMLFASASATRTVLRTGLD